MVAFTFGRGADRFTALPEAREDVASRSSLEPLVTRSHGLTASRLPAARSGGVEGRPLEISAVT